MKPKTVAALVILKGRIEEWAEDFPDLIRYPELFARHMLQEAIQLLGLNEEEGQ